MSSSGEIREIKKNKYTLIDEFAISITKMESREIMIKCIYAIYNLFYPISSKYYSSSYEELEYIRAYYKEYVNAIGSQHIVTLYTNIIDILDYLQRNPLEISDIAINIVDTLKTLEHEDINFREIESRYSKQKPIEYKNEYEYEYKNYVPSVNRINNQQGEGEVFHNLLLRWKIKLFVQLWLQEQSVYFYSIWNNILSYIIILISTGSSATLFSTESAIVKYVIGGLTLGTGILTAVMRQMKPAEKYQEHLITANKYQMLMRKIETYLTLRPNDPDEQKFKEYVEEEINHLIQNQLTPPLYVLHAFKRKYGSIDAMMYGNEIINLMIKDTLASKNLEFIKTKIKKNVRTMEDVQQIYIDMESLQRSNNTAYMLEQEKIKQSPPKKKEKSFFKKCFW